MTAVDLARATEALAAEDAFRVCTHRGTQQIGGTCIELAYGGCRILLDLGLPLDAGDTDPATLLPDVPGLLKRDPGLLALVVSHGHADHWGLAPYAAPGLRIVTGAATRRIMGAAAAFVPRAVAFAEGDEGRMDLVDRQTIQVGPFAITPYLVDHSAYDAYAMLIEAGGRRLFYSADIRGHGRKAALLERLLAHPPLPVHAMLMEGSILAFDPAGGAVEQVDRQPEQVVEVGFEAGVAEGGNQGVKDVGDSAGDRPRFGQWPWVGFVLEGAVAEELEFGEDVVGPG